MQTDGDQYDRAYYACHCGPLPYDRRQKHWGIFFGGIADELIRSFAPRRMFDAGCAVGFLVEAFWDRGVEAYGRDISTYAISQVRPDLRPYCTAGSIAEPISGHYDLITCIEVLEHMEESAAIAAIRAMTRATDRVLFSSSPNDFEEPTHINVRPPIYWLRLFAAQGFAPRLSYDAAFVTPQAIVLERSEAGRREEDLSACAELVRIRIGSVERDTTIRALSATSAELQGQLAAAKNAAVVLQGELDRVKRAGAESTEALRYELAQVSADHTAILGSTIWRRTALLRAGINSLRVALGRGPQAGQRSLPSVAPAPATDVAPAYSSRLAVPVAARALSNPAARRLLIEAIAFGRRTWLWRVLLKNPKVVSFAQSLNAALAGDRMITVASPAVEAVDGEPPPRADYVPPIGLLSWFNPLAVTVLPELAHRPCLNVLLPGLAMKHMTGGPNTAVNLAYRLAMRGVRVRLVSVNAAIDFDPEPFWAHARALAETDIALANIELVDASDRTRPLSIGANDLFMATAWWTAQMAKYAIRHTRHSRFLYLIQDYEPLLHPSSTPQAMAEETYRLDHIPIVNTSVLRDYLAEQRVGQFADPEFAASAIVFEPAVDKTRFYPEPRFGGGTTERKRRLLFYARPTTGLRNAFEMGVAALQKLIADGAIDPTQWEFVGMGDAFLPMGLGGGAQLVRAPWLDFDGYARQMRTSDVLLSPMLSPHPSYPPLEMAACGLPCVTTAFATKSAERLAAISPNIIGVEPTFEALAEGLRLAVERLPLVEENRRGITYPATWAESFAETLPAVELAALREFGAPALPEVARRAEDGPLGELYPGYRVWPQGRYQALRFEQLWERAATYEPSDGDPGLISFLTTVWNTDPGMLSELAQCVVAQDCRRDGDAQAGPGFEWIVLDNGSEREDTRAVLQALARFPWVQLLRVERNAGIVGGMRLCLERARNRYIVPLDSDDLLPPDCVRVLTAELIAAGYPTLAYTDEDKLQDGVFRDPYCKPDWDPVLFVHSCYIAHLCAIDREQALALGAYTDQSVNGSHDWDTFTRFYTAGHTPHHVRHVLYGWRMHAMSTAANIASKDYITASQRGVLERFLTGTGLADRYRIEPSPLFGGTPDWRFVRSDPRPIPHATIVVGDTAEGDLSATGAADGACHVEAVAASAGLAGLLMAAERCAERADFIHLLFERVTVEDPGWTDEAFALFEMFPETVLIGGRIRCGEAIIDADRYFGFGRGCDSPNRGRGVTNPGYFAQMWKPHSASAVPADHCVAAAPFLVAASRRLAGTGASYDYLPAWLGALAREAGGRVVYSPFFLASAKHDIRVPSAEERDAFVLAFDGLLPERELMSTALGLTEATAYRVVSQAERQAQESELRELTGADYASQAAAELTARQIDAPRPDGAVKFSLLTSVYRNTDADLFEETACSLLDQSLPFDEWILLENGPVSEAVAGVLDRLSADARVRRFRAETNLGILGAMRFCLEQATGTHVVPMDADDILVRDALQQLALALADRSAPSFVFADEGQLIDGELTAPFRRPGFDPVLNIADSYIWHPTAFDRERALALGVYSDAGAEFCHDWDTVTRFAAAGDAIRHVPAVLYQWRMHSRSSSNAGALNVGSLASVKHVMTGVIAQQARPDLYRIGAFPISRGVEQYAILRRPVDPLAIDAVVLAAARGRDGGAGHASWRGLPIAETHVLAAGSPDAAGHLAVLAGGIDADFVAVFDSAIEPRDELALWEAMRLFEMHPDVAAAAGRSFASDGTVAAYGAIPLFEKGAAAKAGGRRRDAGPFAMLLKPQTASRLGGGFFICRTALLREAAAGLAVDQAPLRQLPARLTALIHAHGLRIAYSPLIEAVPLGHGVLYEADRAGRPNAA